MDTINLIYDGTTIELKTEEPVYLRIPSIKIHICICRGGNTVTVEQLDLGPIYLEQNDYVSCALDALLTKATVLKCAKVFLRCEKVDGVWKKDGQDFLSITYDSTSPRYRPGNKRKFFAS